MSNVPLETRPTATRDKGRLRAALGSTLGPFLGLVMVIAIFTAADSMQEEGGHFATVRTAQTVLVQAATVAMAGLGMTMIIIAAGIDLSAGTAMALCSVVMAWLLKNGSTPMEAILGAIGTGCLAGLINGALISMLRVVPFIVTLGTMTIYLGLGKIIGHSTTVRPLPAQVPDWISQLLSPRPQPEWLLLPLGVWLVLLLALAVSGLLRYTVFGRHLFALGSSEATARLCGVNVPRTRIAVYTLAGFFVGISGIFLFSRLSSGDATSGTGRELSIIAAVVIGGASLSGGRGSVLGTLTGALIMQVISNGCTALRLPNPTQEIIIGAIIVGAVTLDQVRQHRL